MAVRWLRTVKFIIIVLIAVRVLFLFFMDEHPTNSCKTYGQHVNNQEAVVTSGSFSTQHVQPKPHYSGLFKIKLIGDRNTTVHTYLDRTIEKICDSVNYGNYSNFPKVSVIVTCHNAEKLSNVLITVHSILQRTPGILLEEIILIADNVRKEDLTGILDRYIAAMETGIIRILRSKYQLGLIKARLWGIRSAKAPVVVCMDGHMEVQKRWLEPLVSAILENRKTLASPFMDWMSFDEDSGKWNERHGGSTWKTTFGLNFAFGFQDLSDKDKKKRSKNQTMPIISPVTVGTFAIEKAWFTSIGEFDEEMEAWGGENLDLSIRVWLFGGRVVNVPCSHIAHYEAPDSRAYRQGMEGNIYRNYKRLAEVWLDDYKKYLYYYRPYLKSVDAGNLTSRFELKKKALHRFEWIPQNVFPELGMHDVNTFGHTGVQNLGHKACLTDTGYYLTLSKCDQISGTAAQGFFWTMKGELRFPLDIFNVQMEERHMLKKFQIVTNYQSPRNSLWFHWKEGPLIEAATGLCLEAASTDSVIMNPCNFTLPTQKWLFYVYSADYFTLTKQKDGYKFNSTYLQTLYEVIESGQAGNWVAVTESVTNYKIKAIN